MAELLDRKANTDLKTRRDEAFMRAALAWAEKGEGGTRPNPPVGCVIVRDNEVMASGFHEYAGGPHAEAAALAVLGGEAKGAELYVTLEPCSTRGRTPPCVDAILRAGVRRVVIAATDENPAHAGRGMQMLRDAGIEVVAGVCEREARRMLAPFFKHVKTKRPYVRLKMAQSLDGAIADHAGNSKWITCEESRARVRELRRKSDVVLVGCGTALADDPSLLRTTENDEGGRGLPGMRAVLDSTGRIPLSALIFKDGHASQTIYVTTDAAPAVRLDEVSATGAQVLVLPAAHPANGKVNAKISLTALLERLGADGYMSVLCEGGAELASAFVAEALVDELLLFVAPMVLGAGSKRTFGAFPFDLPTAPRFEVDRLEHIGRDVLLRAFPRTGW